jgi:hypothetical protein
LFIIVTINKCTLRDWISKLKLINTLKQHIHKINESQVYIHKDNVLKFDTEWKKF